MCQPPCTPVAGPQLACSRPASAVQPACSRVAAGPHGRKPAARAPGPQAHGFQGRTGRPRGFRAARAWARPASGPQARGAAFGWPHIFFGVPPRVATWQGGNSCSGTGCNRGATRGNTCWHMATHGRTWHHVATRDHLFIDVAILCHGEGTRDRTI